MDGQVHQPTPLINRLVFAVIAALIIADPIAMIFLYAGGADTPPFVFWMIFSALPIIGLILITFKGDIRLRLDKLWTPIGLVAIIFTIILLITQYDGTSWNNLTESVYYVFGLGLLIAFVDLKILQDYAYFFAFYGLLATLEFFPAGFQAIKMTAENPGKIEWGAWVDELLFITGPLYLYAFYRRMKTNPPGWKKALLGIGGFIVALVLLTIIASMIGRALPEKSWPSNWLQNKKPTQQVSCVGSLCGSDIYIDPYDKLYIYIDRDGLFRDQGSYDFPLLAQDHALLGCSFEINTDQKNLTIRCSKKIKGVNSSSVVFPFQSEDNKNLLPKDKVKEYESTSSN